jgi:16S rRNA C967 or C1407 C5-methylase (RsmB/RsmF family)/NOL1/NOP2/fmu family ribosome biogenesis protein
MYPGIKELEMLPEDFRNRIIRQRYIDAEQLLKALSEPASVSIRTNPAKWNKIPVNSFQVPWCRSGFYLNERPSFTLDPLFHAGCYYPQEASGMFLEQVFLQTSGDKKNIRVLDLCGAPGGKSTHLSALIGSKGFMVANEVIRPRAVILAENLTKWGLSNCIVTQNDPSAFSLLPDFFDLVLIDAPCSGEGMFRDAVAINEWSEENTSLCAERQKRIIMDVWPALREDGILIYSTCTFNPGENEENIKWLTEKQEAESIMLDMSGYEGITEIDYQGITGYGFYPGKIRGEGLFVAVLGKKEKQDKQSYRTKGGNDQTLTREEKEIAGKWTEFPESSLVKFGDEIVSLPVNNEDFKLISKALKIVKPGTRICSVKKKNYLPSHEIALSVYFRKDSFPSAGLDLSDALSYLRRDNISQRIAERGWNAITYNGVNLGFVNNIGTRINNYYPVEWRIRMNIPGNAAGNIISWD